MHKRCAEYVDRITGETQKQYSHTDEDGTFSYDGYEQFLMRLEDEDGAVSGEYRK